MTKKLRITHTNITALVTQKMNRKIVIRNTYNNLPLKHLHYLNQHIKYQNHSQKQNITQYQNKVQNKC